MKRVLTCLIVSLLATSAVAGDKRRIAVLDIRSDAKMDQGMLKTLNEVVLNEFDRTGLFDVLGSADIASMITLEEERIKMTGCADDACLAEIGGALGVQLMGAASIGVVGVQYVLTVKILDVARARVLARATQTLPKRDTELITGIKAAMTRVLGKLDEAQDVGDQPSGDADTPAEGSGAAADADRVGPEGGLAATVEPSESADFLDVAPWLALGLTVAAGGTAAALGGLALGDAREARDEFEGRPEWRDARDAADSKALAADVMIGVAAAAAVGTVVLFVLGSMDDESEAGASVVPVRGGAAGAVSVRFQ